MDISTKSSGTKGNKNTPYDDQNAFCLYGACRGKAIFYVVAKAGKIIQAMGIWYAYKNISKTGKLGLYTGDCPPFFDLKGTPWFDQLNDRLPEIKKKTLELLFEKKIDIPQYHADLLHEGVWESQAFLVCNVTRKLAKGQGREVFEIFGDIPGVISVFISVLKPHTHVKAHNGDTDASYRLHIPILIPAGLPDCGIKVDGIKRPWPEDEILGFCDAHMHEVWNHADKTRVILIADVVRPEYLPQTRNICNEVLSWLLLQQLVQIKIIRVLPLKIKAIIGFTLMRCVRPFFTLLQRR